MLQRWMGAIAAVLIKDGMDDSMAKARGEEALVAIQGALIVARALDDFSVLERTMQRLPQPLCR